MGFFGKPVSCLARHQRIIQWRTLWQKVTEILSLENG
jgi:hypothetical protein